MNNYKQLIDEKRKRITIVVGHYGSGKTEFAVNLALDFATAGKKTALVDLDVANVYFRSRERQQLLEENGVQVYSNIYNHEITADLPALASSIRKPLEDQFCETIVDVGGDWSGARILNQFSKYFGNNDGEMLCVINANRPDTETVNGAYYHIRRIEEETGLGVNGLVNNTHMLMETEIEDIMKGYRLCSYLSQKLQIPLVFNCCMEEVLTQFKEKRMKLPDDLILYPIKLYMRPSWLDR